MKLLISASSGISLLGRMKAPIASSFIVEDEVTDPSLVLGDCGKEKSGLEARMTFAKWVGTEMEGGVPMTSYDCCQKTMIESSPLSICHPAVL